MAEQEEQSPKKDDQAQSPQKDEDQQAPEKPEEEGVYYPALGKRVTAEQLLEETRKKDAELTRLYQERKSAEQEPEDDQSYVPEDQKAQLEQVRQTLEQLGYADKKSVKELVDQELQQRDQVNRLQSQAESLSSKYSGKGEFKDYPKFDEQEVLDHARSKNIGDMETAYESLHRGKIIDAEIKRAQATKSSAGDTSDAPREEPVDRESVLKKLEEVQGSPTKIGEVLAEGGLATPPGER